MDTKIVNKNTNENFIDLNVILRICLRNKFFIFALTSLATFSTIIYSLKQKPVYQGDFQIVVIKNNELGSKSNTRQLNVLLSGKGNDNKTQEYILKSPLVLKPVFNIALAEYKKRGGNDQLEYQSWVNNNLNIKFEEGTQVLKISFSDLEKDFSHE